MRDVEAPLANKVVPKRRLFLVFGLVSITWACFLLWIMHDLRASDHKMEDNLDFKGADIDSVYGVESASECSRACEDHPSCLAFTFVKSEQVCWLKGEGYISRSNPNTVSGAINATLAAIRRARSNWSAADVAPSDSFLEEGQAEGEARGRDDGLDDDSWRRAREAEDAEDAEEEDASRGEELATPEELELFDDATTYFGDVSIHTGVASASECDRLCLADGRCVAWTADKMRSVCLLRLLNASTVRYSADFVGRRLTSAEIASRAERLVNQTAEDRAWDAALRPRRASRVKPARNVSARPAGGNVSASEPDARVGGEAEEEEEEDEQEEEEGEPWGATRGGVAAEAVYAGPAWPLPADHSGVLEDVDLLGGDVGEVEAVDSVGACVAACASRRGCSAWTLSKRAAVCFLKNATHGRVAQNHSRGLVSGTLS